MALTIKAEYIYRSISIKKQSAAWFSEFVNRALIDMYDDCELDHKIAAEELVKLQKQRDALDDLIQTKAESLRIIGRKKRGGLNA